MATHKHLHNPDPSITPKDSELQEGEIAVCTSHGQPCLYLGLAPHEFGAGVGSRIARVPAQPEIERLISDATSEATESMRAQIMEEVSVALADIHRIISDIIRTIRP